MATTSSGVADDPHPRRQRSHRAPAVERQDRREIQKVQEEPEEGERLKELLARDQPDRERHAGAERAEDRAGQPDARLHRRVLRQLLQRDRRTQERDEERRARVEALASPPGNVAELVDEQQEHEPDRELPSPDQRVGADRDEHRRRGREQLELRQDQEDRLELRAELDDQPAPTPPSAAPARSSTTAAARPAPAHSSAGSTAPAGSPAFLPRPRLWQRAGRAQAVFTRPGP